MKDSVNVSAKLGVNKFFINEGVPHIELVKDVDEKEFKKLEAACPAKLYTRDENGTFQFDYAGCLECGTCRVLCGKTILSKWEYPEGTFGVEFRHG